jgi:hypothetical protein
VWIGDGISISNVTGALGRGPHGSLETFEAKVKRTSQKLAQEGVVLYVVDAKGLEIARSQSAEAPGTTPMRGRGRFEKEQDADRLSDDTFPAMERWGGAFANWGATRRACPTATCPKFYVPMTIFVHVSNRHCGSAIDVVSAACNRLTHLKCAPSRFTDKTASYFRGVTA